MFTKPEPRPQQTKPDFLAGCGLGNKQRGAAFALWVRNQWAPENFGRRAAEVTSQLPLRELTEVDFDSLGLLDFVMDFEEYFGVTFSAEEQAAIGRLEEENVTVGEFVAAMLELGDRQAGGQR